MPAGDRNGRRRSRRKRSRTLIHVFELTSLPFLLFGLVTARTVFIPRGRCAFGMLAPRHLRIEHRHRHGRARCPSAVISARMYRIVKFADRYRCAACHSPVALQVDHIKPWAGGYFTALWNLMTLCRACNLVKSNYSQDKDGYEHYHGDRRNLPRARAILAAELRHRWNPVRCLLALIALVAA